VVVDPSSADGQARLAALVAGADVVVDSAPPGTWDALREANPHLVWVSITPFGLTGPRRDWQGSNLIALASSGLLYVTGFQDRPPVAPGGPMQLACQLSALNAAASVLLALRARDQDPEGLGQLVDLSLQECALGISPESGAPLFLDDLVHRDRPGNRRDLTRPFGLYPCQDGFVSFLVLQPAHWQAMATWILDVTGNDALLEEAFADIIVRREASEFVDEWVEAVTTTSTKLELFVEAQRRGIPCTPVNTIADLDTDPHLDAARFFETVEHPAIGQVRRPGPPFRFNHPFWSLGRAPLLGEHTAEVLD
jgi:formyl-CoA transferase